MKRLVKAGRPADARLLFDLLEQHGQHGDLAMLKLAGFEFIGSGATRRIFRKHDWVYKLPYGGRDYCNEIEARQAYRCANMSLPGWRLPQTTLYKRDDLTIVAMEYISDNRPAYGLQAYAIAEQLWSMADIDAYNVRLDPAGMYVVIDMGAHSWHDESDVDGFFKSLEQAA